jgi:hypothetical protein
MVWWQWQHRSFHPLATSACSFRPWCSSMRQELDARRQVSLRANQRWVEGRNSSTPAASGTAGMAAVWSPATIKS